jgi:hypothetical protein
MNNIILDTFNHDKYPSRFLDNIERIINCYTKIEFSNVMKSINIDKLSKIRNILGDICIEEIGFKPGEMELKSRKGNKINASYAQDIYFLSIFYLDKTFIEQLNEILKVIIKPEDLIKERNKATEVIDQLKEATNKKDKEIKNIKRMSTDATLKEILSKLQSIGEKVEGVSNKQNEMQIQLDLNSESIRNINEKLNEPTFATGGMEENHSTKINEDEEYSQMELINNNSKKRKVGTNNENVGARKILSSTKYQLSGNQAHIKRPKTVIIGTHEGKADKIKAAERSFEVFVGNLDIKTEINAVIDMFSRNGIKVLDYIEIQTRLNKTKAFAVSINYSDKDKIFKATNWEKGVSMSKYFRKDNRNYSNKSSSNAVAGEDGRK